MDALELLDTVGSGETSKVQFKEIIDNDEKFAQEMIAMSNSKGGMILLGVKDKTGDIVGLTYEQLQASGNNYNSRVATIANEKIKPQIFVLTEVVTVSVDDETKKVLVVHVDEGTNKPYKNKDGAIYVKQGSDKRKLTDNNEILRLFQQGGNVYLDEMVIPNSSINDIDRDKLKQYIEKLGGSKSENEIEITPQIINNLMVTKADKLTLGGLLFFGKQPQKYKPEMVVKAISFYGDSIGGSDYRDSRNVEGTIPEIFERTIDFFKSNLHHKQKGQNFNKTGVLEISEIALEELIQNALIHRDYSRNSPTRVMIFDNRVEIVSPGALPNSLTVENIKMGNAVVRNNLMVSYCSKLMNYRGFGSGITRALENQPNIELINDIEGEQFKVIIPREQ